MDKTRKNYRLSAQTMEHIEYLKSLRPGWSETAVIEQAIRQYAYEQRREGAQPNPGALG